MAGALEITNVTFKSASAEDVKSGLIGWLAFTVNDVLRIDGVSLRRTADNRLTLSYPYRETAAGHEFYAVRPVDDITRRDIEHQVFTALGIQETAAR